MGAGEGGYVRITLQTRLSDYSEKADRLHRISELRFATAPTPDDADHADIPNIGTTDPGPPPGTPPAGKLGLGGVKPRDVLAFNLFARLDDDTPSGMGVAADRRVTDELEDAFGGDWAGFAVALAPMGGRFRLVADITLRPRWKKRAKKPFQVIPVVMAFGTDRFSDHYLMAVIIAQETVDKVDTSVTQPYR
jgi:hypothetical protein